MSRRRRNNKSSFNDIEEYFTKNSWRVKENSNFNFSYSGLLAHVANKRMANYAISKLPYRVKQAYINGDYHIHNLDGGMVVGYCHGGSLQGILQSGVRSADIKSGPAKHFDTALSHVVNYFFMSQLEWSGAQSFSDFDTLLAPFIHYDNLSYDQVKQSIQRMVWDLNFACRQAFQTPFTNLTFNMCAPKQLADKPVVIGGKFKDNTYADFQDEIEMINIAFVDVLLSRDSDGRPFTFPIPTLNLGKNIKWKNNETLDEIIRETTILGSYYFMNYIGSGINEDTVRAMCCRLNLNLDELSSARGAWNMGDGTGSLGVVTINMPRLGYLYKNKGEDALLDRLGYLMDLAKKQLMIKREMVQRSLDAGILPFAKYYGINLDHYFNTIGLLGLNEMCLNFSGSSLTSNVDFVHKVLTFMRKKTAEMQQETGCLFNLEMTPGEGSSYKLALVDRKKHKDIVTLGTKSKPYYTTLLTSPSEDVGIFERLNNEEKLLPIFTGGTVCRNYIGDASPDVGAIKKFVNRLANSKIPYFDITCSYSICNTCGEMHRNIVHNCHKCNSDNISVYSRVTGYYRPVDKWNVGKQQEFKDRKYITL